MYNEAILELANTNLKSRMDHYAALGHPGCMGSVDCTRLLWARCPKALRNFATGKEKAPAVSFLVVCDHNRQVIYVSEHGYLGGMNDINISNLDPMMVSLRSGDFANVPFSLVLPDGKRLHCYGAYFISDNGFFESSVLMDPPKNRHTEIETLWAEWLESSRKDIECFFVVSKWYIVS